MKLTKSEKIFYGIGGLFIISVFILQFLRFHGIIVVDPYLNLL